MQNYDIHKILGFIILAPPESRADSGSLASLHRIFATGCQTLPESELAILTFPSSGSSTFIPRKRLPGDWSELGNQYLYIDRFSAEVYAQYI